MDPTAGGVLHSAFSSEHVRIHHSIPSAPMWQLGPAPNYKVTIPKNFLGPNCMESFNLLLKDVKEEI